MKFEQAVDTSGLIPIDIIKGFIIIPPPIPRLPAKIPANKVINPMLIVIFLFQIG